MQFSRLCVCGGIFGGHSENFPQIRGEQRHPIYWSSFPVRLLALALAFVFAAAPIAAEVCETTCVEHVGHSEGVTSGSHHHHGSSTVEHAGHYVATQTTSSTNGHLATSLSHDCCFSAAVLTDSRDSNRGVAPSAALTTPSTGALTVVVSQPARVSHRHRPPVLIRPLSQLRT